MKKGIYTNQDRSRKAKWLHPLCCLLTFFCFFNFSLQAQTIPVSGTVTNDSSQAVPGVTVAEKKSGKTVVNGVYQALRSSNCIGEGSQLWTDDRFGRRKLNR